MPAKPLALPVGLPVPMGELRRRTPPTFLLSCWYINRDWWWESVNSLAFVAVIVDALDALFLPGDFLLVMTTRFLTVKMTLRGAQLWPNRRLQVRGPLR